MLIGLAVVILIILAYFLISLWLARRALRKHAPSWATGKDLDRLAETWGVSRRDGESDSALRIRIKSRAC